MTYTLIVSSQGQIVIPVKIRQILGLKTGSKVNIRVKQDTAIPTAVIEPPTSWVARVKGISGGIYGKGEEYVAAQRQTWDK